MFFSAMRVSWLSAGEASPTISLRCVLKGGASPGKSAMYGGSENTAQMRLERHPSPAPIIWAPVKVHPWPHSAASPLRKKGLPCMPIEARSSHESQERTFCTRLASAPQVHVGVFDEKVYECTCQVHILLAFGIAEIYLQNISFIGIAWIRTLKNWRCPGSFIFPLQFLDGFFKRILSTPRTLYEKSLHDCASCSGRGCLRCGSGGLCYRFWSWAFSFPFKPLFEFIFRFRLRSLPDKIIETPKTRRFFI